MGTMIYCDFFSYGNLLRHPSGRRKRSLIPEKIPPFGGRIIDVDYEEVGMRITDPGRLLPEHSMTPYNREERRREDMYIGIVEMDRDVERVLRRFERERLHIPRGAGKCPYLWESRLGDDIHDAFDELTEEIRDAVSRFRESALQAAWHLHEAFGCNDAEYRRYVKDESERMRMLELQQDFIYDLLHIGGNCAPDDDLPF